MLHLKENPVRVECEQDRKFIQLVWDDVDVFKRSAYFEIPAIPVISPQCYPISQVASEYASMKYGEIGTIASDGSGPIAIEHVLRLKGKTQSFKQLVTEIVLKGYRAYKYDPKGRIVGGFDTEVEIFNQLAKRLKNTEQLIQELQNGTPITLRISKGVYYETSNRKNCFVNLIGIDENENAILADGKLIENPKNPQDSIVTRPFREILKGVREAWAWSKDLDTNCPNGG